MLVEGIATYEAGGERHGGTVTVSVNVEENDDVKGKLAERARNEVARRLCLKPTEVRITSVTVV